MSGPHDPRISGYLDGELEPTELAEFEAELARSPELRAELDAMRSMRDVTASMRLKEFPDQAWDRYWEQTWNRNERKVGWTLVSIGAAILLGAWLYQVVPQFLDWVLHGEDRPFWFRGAVALLSLGLAVLVVSVLREKLFVRRRDPYREVRR